ncbi:MAG TPA: ABC transporter permease, partial [Puia sp.]|nr:ABC transporter permease [Puia sp.]
MLKNYFKIAWRNLWKNRFYTMLNVSGLASGLAVGILIFIWVEDELSYDNFHRHVANIYKINSHLGTGTSAQVWSNAPSPLAVFCKESIPEVKDAVRIKERENQLLFSYRDHKFLETSSAFVDPSFFSVFDFVLLKGNPVRPFLDAHSVILTGSVAKKYFGDENPIGKILVADNKENFTVSAVLKDFPENSSIHYNLLFPMSLFASNFQGNGEWKTIDQDLGNFMYSIFLQLKQGASSDVVSRKISRIYRDKKGPDGKDDFFSLQSLKTLHLTTADGGSAALQTVRIFLIVGILILLIACINYVNLSTARSVIRSKEVSIRKIVGAARFQLLIQFFVESMLLFALSSFLALL